MNTIQYYIFQIFQSNQKIVLMLISAMNWSFLSLPSEVKHHSMHQAFENDNTILTPAFFLEYLIVRLFLCHRHQFHNHILWYCHEENDVPLLQCMHTSTNFGLRKKIFSQIHNGDGQHTNRISHLYDHLYADHAYPSKQQVTLMLCRGHRFQSIHDWLLDPED